MPANLTLISKPKSNFKPKANSTLKLSGTFSRLFPDTLLIYHSYEHHDALDGGLDGLDVIRCILQAAPNFVTIGG